MALRDQFRKNPDGSYSPIQTVTIEGPNGKVKLSPNARFGRGARIMGLNIVEMIEAEQ